MCLEIKQIGFRGSFWKTRPPKQGARMFDANEFDVATPFNAGEMIDNVVTQEPTTASRSGLQRRQKELIEIISGA